MKFQKLDLQLIVYDFDGVMTDNKVLINENGSESVYVNRSDGLAVSLIKKLQVPQIIISTEKNDVVRARAKKLDIFVLNGIDNKKKALEDYCKKNKIDLKCVMYVGNDLNDLEVMKIVGIPVCPKDAYPEIRRTSKFTTRSKGGDGVIRELLGNIN